MYVAGTMVDRIALRMESQHDILWRREGLYLSCLREVAVSKQIAFPKGSLRRGQTKSLGLVATPFGTVELSVYKDEQADLSIEHNKYIGELLGNDGGVCGRCFFSTYRTVRGRGWLTDEAIFVCMDAMSEEACDWYETLSGADDADLEYDFNLDGLLTADSIWIAPELRGTQAWKVLYFCTMSSVFVHQRRMYEEFVFKAHPLVNRDEVGKIPKAELQHQARQLRRFYAVHFDARVIRSKEKPTEYMRAPVPEALCRAWIAI